MAESIGLLLQGAKRPSLRLNVVEIVFDTKHTVTIVVVRRGNEKCRQNAKAVRSEAWSVTTKEGTNPYFPEKKPRTSKHFVHVA